MLRVTLPFLILGSFAPAPPSAERPKAPGHEETIVVSDTGGESARAAQPDLGKVERAVVERTNAFRKEEDRKPLVVSEKLTAAARGFARYMAETGRYGHLADEKTPADRVTAAGYEHCTVRENIAYAFRSDGFATDALAAQFFTGWKESPGHRENMLAGEVVETGVAIAKSAETDTYFAVQLFGRPQSMAIDFEVANRSELTVAYRVGERSYSLPPRVVRTHTECQPRTVTFLPPADDGDAKAPADPIAKIEASGGERLTVEGTADGYRVSVGRVDPDKS